MVLQLTIEWPNINIGIPALSAVTWSMCWKISLRYKSKCDTWALSPSLWPWPTEKKKHYKPFFSSLSLQNVASFYISKKNCIFTGKISIFPSCDLSPPTTPLENCSFYHFNSLGKFPVSPVRPMIFNGWVWRLWVWLFSGATAFKSTDIDSKLRVFLKPLRVEIFSDVHLSFTLPFSCR